MATCTLRRVVGDRSRPLSFITRETTDCATPNFSAISFWAPTGSLSFRAYLAMLIETVRKSSVHCLCTYTNCGRLACQDFSFGEFLLPQKHYGDRLREEIDRLGVSYNDFGDRVAQQQKPPRHPPYRKNNVEGWVSARTRPSQEAWAAIELVTSKPLRWFIHGETAEVSLPKMTHHPVATGAAKKKGGRRLSG